MNLSIIYKTAFHLRDLFLHKITCADQYIAQTCLNLSGHVRLSVPWHEEPTTIIISLLFCLFSLIIVSAIVALFILNSSYYLLTYSFLFQKNNKKLFVFGDSIHSSETWETEYLLVSLKWNLLFLVHFQSPIWSCKFCHWKKEKEKKIIIINQITLIVIGQIKNSCHG